MRRLISFAALLGMALAQPALAQMSAPAAKSGAPAPGAYAALPCDGDVANVRLTQILPTGTMKGYLQAVDEHRAWYRAHGYKDNQIFVSRLMVPDPAKHELKYSDTEVLAFHIRPPFMPGSKNHDAAWDLFHKHYSENSKIEVGYNVCMPKNR